MPEKSKKQIFKFFFPANSFLLHQIRKMIAMISGILAGYVPPSMITSVTFFIITDTRIHTHIFIHTRAHRIAIDSPFVFRLPLAPPSFLFLADNTFTGTCLYIHKYRCTSTFMFTYRCAAPYTHSCTRHALTHALVTSVVHLLHTRHTLCHALTLHALVTHSSYKPLKTRTSTASTCSPRASARCTRGWNNSVGMCLCRT